MDIVLFHGHYDPDHLKAVCNEMRTLGAPTIRAAYNVTHNVWMAVEGCHRVRAAHALGLTPTIIDIGGEEVITIQSDDDDVEVTVADLVAELYDQAHRMPIFRFA